MPGVTSVLTTEESRAVRVTRSSLRASSKTSNKSGIGGKSGSRNGGKSRSKTSELTRPKSTPTQGVKSRVHRASVLALKRKEKRDLAKLTLVAQKSTETLNSMRDEILYHIKKRYEIRTAPEGDELTAEDLARFTNYHHTVDAVKHTSNALASVPASYLAENRDVLKDINYAYSVTLDRCPRATSQDYSGRCWMFAALNAIRYPLIRRRQLSDTFELSEAYLFFYEKIERVHYFLEKMVELRERPLLDPVVYGMLTTHRPVEDGGTFSFFRDLIVKYGIVPKNCYGENFNTRCTQEMNDILWQKVSEFAENIRSSSASSSNLRKKIKTEMMPVVYSLMSCFMGEPPKTFTWSYYEAGESYEDRRSHGTYHCIPDLTPKSFYDMFVLPEYDVRKKILLRHDPRKTSEYYQTYRSDHHGHMVSAPPGIAFNVPLSVFKYAAAKSISLGQPVWFDCDVIKDFNQEYSLLSTEAYNYDTLFGTTFPMDKGQMLTSFYAGPAHAMLLVGVDMPDEDVLESVGSEGTTAGTTETAAVESKIDDITYRKWRVENSWGYADGEPDPGYLQMSDTWFDTYVYEVVVDIDVLPADVYAKYREKEYTPVILPYNDPFSDVAVSSPPVTTRCAEGS